MHPCVSEQTKRPSHGECSVLVHMALCSRARVQAQVCSLQKPFPSQHSMLPLKMLVCFLSQKCILLSDDLKSNSCKHLFVPGEASRHFLFCCCKIKCADWKGRVHFTLESFKGNMGQSLPQEDENHFWEVITKVAKRSLSGLEPEYWRSQLGSCGHFIDHSPLISFPGYSEEPRKDREET